MFKPLLAYKVKDFNDLSYPLYASPKLDGIRAIIIDGVVMSRSMKPIPNRHVQKLFGKAKYNGFDGELIVGDECSPNVYRDTSSGVMSHDGEPDVKFHVFDIASEDKSEWPYDARNGVINFAMMMKLSPDEHEIIIHVKQVHIGSPKGLLAYEELCLDVGYEGIMVRAVEGVYKHGRSTAKEGIIGKVKRFSDSEAVIICYGELMHNDNEKTVGALGRSKRSSHKANKRGGDVLGYITVRDLKTGVEFDIGSGFSAMERDHLWLLGDELLGMIVKYKHFEVGVKDKPRFPTFLGFRSTLDMVNKAKRKAS